MEDNGKGFDISNHQSEGIGLRNIRNQVDLNFDDVDWFYLSTKDMDDEDDEDE